MAKKKKTGGRKAGTPNKVTGSMRELLGAFMSEKWPTVQTAFGKLRPKEKVYAFTRLLPFVTPQYSAINFSMRSMSTDDLKFILDHLKQDVQDNGDQERTD